MKIIGNKIFLIYILLSSSFILNGHNFLHQHESEEDSQCYFCFISSYILSDDVISENNINPEFHKEYTFQLYKNNIVRSEFFKCNSDRAPPLT